MSILKVEVVVSREFIMMFIMIIWILLKLAAAIFGVSSASLIHNFLLYFVAILIVFLLFVVCVTFFNVKGISRKTLYHFWVDVIWNLIILSMTAVFYILCYIMGLLFSWVLSLKNDIITALVFHFNVMPIFSWSEVVIFMVIVLVTLIFYYLSRK